MEKNKLPNEALLTPILPDQKSRNFLVQLIDMLPGIVAILDAERRLIYSNRTLENIIEGQDLATAFNLRPGEVFQCVNAQKMPGGCGASKACEFCGAMRALNQSRSEDKTISSEYRIYSAANDQRKAYNFMFTATPLHHGESFFYLVTLEDVSEKNRKAALERIFYHDLMNSLTSLHGVINLIREKNQPDLPYLDILESTYNAMFDAISEQQQYSLAEGGQLSIKKEEIHSRDLLIEAAIPFGGDSPSTSKVELEEEIAELIFVSDPSLLGRVLTNMIKNAVEASEPEQPVRIGADLAENHIRFWVHNQGMIPWEVQQQIFERSFSTKGEGRGIGTFSMKLIGESYLDGRVDFSSDENNGTIFWIEIPIHP